MNRETDKRINMCRKVNKVNSRVGIKVMKVMKVIKVPKSSYDYHNYLPVNFYYLYLPLGTLKYPKLPKVP